MPEQDNSQTDPNGTKPNDSGQVPPWGDEFDAERAWRLVQDLRTDKDKLKAERDAARQSVQEREDAEKSELTKAQERAQRLEADLSEAQRSILVRDIAEKHKVPAGLLTGKSEEEIEASAKALAEWRGQAPAGDGKEDPASGGNGTTRPKPKLTPADGSGDDSAPFDPEAVAKAARR